MDTRLAKHSIRQLAANKVRLAITAAAITISVAFVSAAFTLGDGISEVIFGWGETQAAGLDLMVEPDTPFVATNFEVSPARVSDDTLQLVRSVDGVTEARPALWTDNLLRPTMPGGELIEDKFTVATHGWVDGGSFTMVDGAPPVAEEFSIDIGTAESMDYVVGDTYQMTTPTGTRPMRLSGIMRLTDTSGTTAGQVVQAIPLGELQATLGQPGYVNLHVNIANDADLETVRAAIEQALPEDLDVLTQDEVRARLRDQVAPFARGFRGGFLGFSGLAMFVAAFMIYNTFSVLMQQRTREIGLLRAVGASPGQIRTAIRFEAILLAVVASTLGIVGGLGVSWGISEMFHSAGGLPKPDLSLTPLSIIVSLTVGIVATLIASSAPARAACRIPVVVALRDGHVERREASRLRFAIGAVMVVSGAIALGFGLAVDLSAIATITVLALGAVMVFIGVAILNPLWISPFVKGLAAPLVAVSDVPGRLARDNIGRNRTRSASTAAALMVGLALVSLVLVVGESFKATVSRGAETAYLSDHIVVSQLGYKYPLAVAENLEKLPEVQRAVAISQDLAKIDGRVTYLTVADQSTAGDLIDFEITERADNPEAVAHPVLVTEREAREQGIALGDELATTFFNGRSLTLTVVGFHSNNTAGGNAYYIDRATWSEFTNQTTADLIAVQSSPDVTAAQFETAMTQFEAANEQVDVQTIDDFVASTADTVNTSLQVVNAMMFLAVVIAFLGIANTLALAITERTREMGLLRAVGMRRRLLRRSLRFEALLISMFGAIVGLALGVLFGIGSVFAIPPSVIDTVQVPFIQLGVLLVVASLAGVIAAAVPAWRASKRNPLELLAG